MQTKIKFLLIVLFFLNTAASSFGLTEETPTIAIEKAKFAIEQAQKAGASKTTPEDLAAAKSWLASAQKEYEKLRSPGTWMTPEKTRRLKEEEIIYLATMAKIRAMVAENRAKKEALSKKLQTHIKELEDHQNKLDLLKKNLAEKKKNQEFQAQIETKRKALAAIKEQLGAIEQEKKLILAESLNKVREIEMLKQRELEEFSRKEAQRTAEIEKELAAAKFKLEELTKEKIRAEAEKKIQDEKLTQLQEKVASLERKIALFIATSKISEPSIKFTEKEITINILAQQLFSPTMEIKNPGKQTLDQISSLLNTHPDYQIIVRGHTDNRGNPASNQVLSEKRAQKVRDYLVINHNVNPARISAEGWGASQPIAPNDTEAGRMLNRRVEIIMIIEK